MAQATINEGLIFTSGSDRYKIELSDNSQTSRGIIILDETVSFSIEGFQSNLELLYHNLNAYFILYSNDIYTSHNWWLGYYNFMFKTTPLLTPEIFILLRMYLDIFLAETRFMLWHIKNWFYFFLSSSDMQKFHHLLGATLFWVMHLSGQCTIKKGYKETTMPHISLVLYWSGIESNTKEHLWTILFYISWIL